MVACLTGPPGVIENGDVALPTKLICAAVIAVAAIAAATFGGLELQQRAARSARARAEPWRQTSDWRGTKLQPVATGIPSTVLRAFAADPPAPRERKELFRQFLTHGSDYPCTGWYGTIELATANADGWKVTVKIGAHLKSLRGGIPHCPAMSSENWQVSRSGAARCLSCDAVGPFGVLWVD